MDFNAFLERVLFEIGGNEITIQNVVLSVLAILAITVLYRLVFHRWIPKYYDNANEDNLRKLKRQIKLILFLATVIGLIWSLELDYVLYENETIAFTILTALQAILILLLARLFDWVISKALAYNYERSRTAEKPSKISEIDKKPSEKTASRTVQYTVYLFAALLILETFQLDYVIYPYGQYEFKISTIFWAILIFLFARLSVWVITQLFLFTYYKRK